MALFHGVDTSNNQGPGVIGVGPDIVGLGGQAWWHKATQGAGYRDRYWPACRQARIDVGLRYGGPYHWLEPNVPVLDQFKNFRDYVGGLTVGEAIQLDIEDPAGLSDATVFEAIELWENEWPGRVFHYMGHYYMGGLRQRCVDRYGDGFRHWLAWYTSTFPNVGYTPAMWQYAGGATGVVLMSIGRRVDSNQIMDLPRVEAASGYGGSTPVPPSGGPMSGTIVRLTDSWAVLEGDMNAESRIMLVRWIGQDILDDRLRAGYKEIVRTTGDLHSMTYVGSVLPSNDIHSWTGKEFHDVVGPQSAGQPVNTDAIIAAAVAAARADLRGRL